MQKELWRNRWLSCINELTSMELQKKYWLDKSNENPHWSFIEFMSGYFDDLGIDNDYENQLKNNWISEEEFSVIIEWHKKLEKYEAPKKDDYDVEGILKDENWQQIVCEGDKVKKKLGKLLNSAERNILIE